MDAELTAQLQELQRQRDAREALDLDELFERFVVEYLAENWEAYAADQEATLRRAVENALERYQATARRVQARLENDETFARECQDEVYRRARERAQA